MSDSIKVTERKLSDYRPDPHNPNKGNERGQYMIEESIARTGVGRSLVADGKDTLVAGNKTTEALAAAGIEKVIEIETDGDTIIVHKRRDFDLDDPDNPAREYSIWDNRTPQESIAWDAIELARFAEQGLDLELFFREDELETVFEELLVDESSGDADLSETPIEPPEFITFKFGEYSGKVSKDVYTAFIARYHQMRDENNLILMDDILRGWLNV